MTDLENSIYKNLGKEEEKFAALCLFKFMSAVNNYRFHKHHKLIKYATSVCVAYASFDPDTALEEHRKFTEEICELEMYGTADMFESIDKVAEKAKQM